MGACSQSLFRLSFIHLSASLKREVTATGLIAMKKFLITFFLSVLIIGGLFGLFMLALVSWGYQIGVYDQIEDLWRFATLLMVPVVPLLIWYISESVDDNDDG